MSKRRTASEIRAYCEAATPGPWTKNERWYGDIYSPVHGDLGRMYHANNHEFCTYARINLPRVLGTAVKRGAALDKLLAALGRNIDEPMPGLDDAWGQAGALQAETAWLEEDDRETPVEQVLRHIEELAVWVADSSEPTLSTDEENGEEHIDTG